MDMSLTHCYLAPFGLLASISFLVYVIARVLFFYKKFSSAETKVSSVLRIKHDRRTDLPEGDLKRMPDFLKYRSVDASFKYEKDIDTYVTSCLSVWDYVGIWNVSGEWIDRFKEGDQVPIYVSQANPRRAVLSKEIKGSGLFETVVVAMAVFGFSIFLASCSDDLTAREFVITGLAGLAVGGIAVIFSFRKSSKKIWSEPKGS